jgi:predicted acyl esterase
VQHHTYGDFWKQRALTAHLESIHCATLSVAGWFDAEDLQGPVAAYQTIKANNPKTLNAIVAGPWVHGGWVGLNGHRLGHVDFAADTGDYCRKNVVFPFFERYLKGLPGKPIAAAAAL